MNVDFPADFVTKDSPAKRVFGSRSQGERVLPVVDDAFAKSFDAENLKTREVCGAISKTN